MTLLSNCLRDERTPLGALPVGGQKGPGAAHSQHVPPIRISAFSRFSVASQGQQVALHKGDHEATQLAKEQ